MRAARAILAAFAAAALAAGAAAPAQAKQRVAHRHKTAHHHHTHRHLGHALRPLGVVGRRGGSHRHASARAAASVRFTYHGGPVMHSSSTYAIYWLPSGYQFGSDSAGFESTVDQYLTDVAADSGRRSNVYATDAQYTDTSGRAAYDSQFKASTVATDAFPSSGCTVTGYALCINDAQIETEIDHVISAQGWTRGPSSLFVIFTPQGVGSCFDASSTQCDAPSGYCAYHAQFGTEGSPAQTLYANIPYADVSGCNAYGQYPNGPGAADPAINLVSHEHNEAVTDPWGDAWYDQSGNEDGDECAWDPAGSLGGASGAEYNQVINGHGYYLQPEWSNVDGGCVMDESAWAAPASVSLTVTPGGTQAPGTSLQFAATATGGSIAGPAYRWAFGDGTSGSGATITHSYTTSGTRTAGVTVTDAFGATATSSQSVVTAGPVADIALPSAAVAGTPLTFGPGSSSDADGTITSYAWSFGDGGTGTGASPQHTYAGAGTYTVRLTVTDSNGYTSAPVTRSLSVSAPPPPAPAAPAPPPTTTAPVTTSPVTSTPAPPPATPATVAVAVPRLTIGRIASVRVRRGRGTLVLHVRSSVAGRVTVTFRGVRRTFRLRAGANTLRIAIRGGHAGHPRVTLRPAALDGTRGTALRRHVTLRLR